MPKITVNNQTITCEYGENLRKVLLANNIQLYNGKSKYINCRGLGSCGTCAVEIIGTVSDRNWKENIRLSLPPHNPENDRRLACQTKVFGDIIVKKYEGFWGEK